MGHDVATFEACRTTLVALAYRMLGDLGRAEDVVQEAWIRWERREVVVESPPAYLVKTVTRLCLNELASARARREEARSDRLPEPVDLARAGLDRIDTLDRVSMAFLLVLQRLTPGERAALLLHDVFEFDHAEIATLLERSEAACRQLLKRARDHVAAERRAVSVPAEVHRRLLRAFVKAAESGDTDAVARLLAEDAVLIVDGGPGGGRYGRVRNLPRPLAGAAKIAAFIATVTPQGAAGLETRECELNGQPALLVLRDGEPRTAILLVVSDAKIRGVFMHADPARLGHVS